MSENLKRFLPILEYLIKIRNLDDRKEFLRILAKDKNFVKAIKEIAINTVEKNIHLSKEDKRKLRKHKTTLVELGSRGGKGALIQSGGGFLSVLVPIVSAILGPLLNGSN